MSFADLLATPGVREEIELRGNVGFLAFHGGVEGGTYEIARDAAELSGASLYAVVQPDELKWHIPSVVVGTERSETMSMFLEHVDIVVAVHGYGRRDRPRQLLLGGQAREMAARLATVLRSHLPDWEVIDEIEEIPAILRGLHPRNPVNLTRVGGVQLELPPRVRDTAWPDNPAPNKCTPVDGIVDGLAAFALSARDPRPAP